MSNRRRKWNSDDKKPPEPDTFIDVLQDEEVSTDDELEEEEDEMEEEYDVANLPILFEENGHFQALAEYVQTPDSETIPSSCAGCMDRNWSPPPPPARRQRLKLSPSPAAMLCEEELDIKLSPPHDPQPKEPDLSTPALSPDISSVEEPSPPPYHRPYSHLTSPSVSSRRILVEVEAEIENPGEVEIEWIDARGWSLDGIPSRRPGRGLGRGGGRGRGRGGGRGRGRGGGQGRGSRSATYAASKISDWRRGQDLVEICLDDMDVPVGLREMIDNIINRRRIRPQGKVDDDDEFFDAEDGTIVAQMFNGDKSALNFEWEPMVTFQGSPETFLVENPGPNGNFSTAYDAFRNYWDDSILQHIVLETNRHAAKIAAESASFAWIDTNIHEILILFSFWMMLGIVRMPSINSCFANSYLLKTEIFRKLLTQRRYWSLNRAFHLYDKSTAPPGKLRCLGPVLDALNEKFMSSYTLNRDIAIDESLTLWKGNLSFRQYIKTKAARFGVKTYELCESASGYLWSLFIYTGRDNSAPRSQIPKSTDSVLRLIRPLLNKGYRLFMDNWFNSPILARYLKMNNTDCVGTLRSNCQHVPPLVKHATLPEGHFIARHCGDVVVMAYQDKNTVRTISTCHGSETILVKGRPGRPEHFRPRVIYDYNHSMGGVDKKDQMLEPYLIERKRCQKWYKKIFKRLLNVSILNSRVLVWRSTGNCTQQLAFRLELVDQIIKAHLNHVPAPRQRNVNNHRGLPSDRFVHLKHYLIHLHPTDADGRHRGQPRECLWCQKSGVGRPRRTSQKCAACNVALCKEPCFKKYHEAQDRA